MSDNPKEAEKQKKKKIFIPDDVWHNVFDLLPPCQLGLQIALISDRFDARMDEHFKTRRRTLDFIRIWFPNEENVVQIVNARGQPLPMPTVPMPGKVDAFNGFFVNYLDRSVMAFLDHFRRLFAACGTLSIKTNCVRLLESILRNIPSTAGVHANSPSSAADGQPLLINWLCSPSVSGIPPKLLSMDATEKWMTRTTDQIKAAFHRASSPATFIAVFRNPLYDYWFHLIDWGSFFGQWTNTTTGERLSVERRDDDYLLIVRCPISRDVPQWNRWEDEAIGWTYDGPRQRIRFDQQRNRIFVCIRDGSSVGDSPLGNDNDDSATVPGPSVQQQQQMEVEMLQDENDQHQQTESTAEQMVEDNEVTKSEHNNDQQQQQQPKSAFWKMMEKNSTFLDDNTAAVPVRSRQEEMEAYNQWLAMFAPMFNDANDEEENQDDDDDNDDDSDDDDNDD